MLIETFGLFSEGKIPLQQEKFQITSEEVRTCKAQHHEGREQNPMLEMERKLDQEGP